MQDFFRSEGYRRLRELMRAGDFAGARKLVESMTDRTEGRERALWLVARAGGKINLTAPPVAAIMADMREALATAPDDQVVEEAVLRDLLGLMVRAERLENAPYWFALLRRVMRRAKDPFPLWFNLGTFQWRRMRPRAAVRNYTRALDGMYTWDLPLRQANEPWFYMGHCYRALAAMEIGRTDLARGDVTTAEALLPVAGPTGDLLLRLAQAALALQEGNTAHARSRLQLIRVGDQAQKYLRAAHPIRAEVELMAARIALAEGNLPAFDHFSSRSLAMAEEHQLPLTARRIVAVRKAQLPMAPLVREEETPTRAE